MRVFYRKSHKAGIVMSMILFLALVIFLLVGRVDTHRETTPIFTEQDSTTEIQYTTVSSPEPTHLTETEPAYTENTVTEVITTYPSESVPIAEYLPVGTMSSLFIGDSRTVGLADYADLDNATFFASVGMTVYNVWENKVSVPKIGKVRL